MSSSRFFVDGKPIHAYVVRNFLKEFGKTDNDAPYLTSGGLVIIWQTLNDIPEAWRQYAEPARPEHLHNCVTLPDMLYVEPERKKK